MSYIQRYQRLSPDLQTEWGTFTNPHIAFDPDQYKYRQPAVPLLATGRSDVIHPKAMPPQHLGYVGDYVASPMGSDTLLGGDTFKTILILAGVALVLYFLFRDKDGAKSNPCVSDFNALLESGWTHPSIGGGAGSSSPKRRFTREGLKRLSRSARTPGRRDPATGRFIRS